MPQVKGAIPWNKGLRNHLPPEVIKKYSDASKKTRNFTGKKHTLESKLLMKIKKIGKIPANAKFPGDKLKTKEYRVWSKNARNRRKRKTILDLGTHTFGEWELLKKQYGFTCPCCKKQEPEIKLTEDHIVPLSKGGSDLIENIQPLCLTCNIKKHTNIIKY